MDLHIATLHGSINLAIHNVEALADAFFRYDPSSAHADSYDCWIEKQSSPANRIVADDVHAINRTMAARSKVDAWQDLTGAGTDLAALAALDSTWNLFTLSDTAWQEHHCQQVIEQALRSVLGPYRNLSVATKVLHAKRPHFIPVLDSYVVQVLGGPPDLNATSGARVIGHLRAQGRANLEALQTLQAHLHAQRIDRTLVRILDALLWLSHPGAWGSKAYQHLTSAHVALTIA